MSQTTDRESGSREPERIRLADDVVVLDAFVDWNVNCSNPPELVVRTNTEIAIDSFEPFTGDIDDGRVIQANGYGVYAGIQPHLPVSEETGAATGTYEHVDGDVEAYRALHHTVKRDVNEMYPKHAFSVLVNPDEGYLRDWTITAQTGRAIIDRYVNGSGGTDVQGYWLWKRDPYDWRSATTSREDHEAYEGATVRLVADDIHTWYPECESEIDAGQETYRSETA